MGGPSDLDGDGDTEELIIIRDAMEFHRLNEPLQGGTATGLFDGRNDMMGMSGIMVAIMSVWMMFFGGFFGHMGIG